MRLLYCNSFVWFQVGPAIDHRRHGHEQGQEGFDRQQLDDDDVHRVQWTGLVERLSKPHAERSPGKSCLKKKKTIHFIQMVCYCYNIVNTQSVDSIQCYFAAPDWLIIYYYVPTTVSCVLAIGHTQLYKHKSLKTIIYYTQVYRTYDYNPTLVVLDILYVLYTYNNNSNILVYII